MLIEEICGNCGKVFFDDVESSVGTCSIDCIVDDSDDCPHQLSSAYCVKCHPPEPVQLELDLGV